MEPFQAASSLRALRDEFIIPTNMQIGASKSERGEEPCTYLCGSSLGLLPKRSKQLLEEEVHVWASRAVEGHFSHPHGRPWVSITDHVNPLLAELVGAREKEVACMGSLTANLHLLMDSFYKPTPQRYKILCEADAFPSDRYAFVSQAKLHGLDPETTVREISPRAGEFIIRSEDILNIIAKEGSSIAVVLFSGVQFKTGQLFPMELITRQAQAQGCIVGWDLAHAIGNVPLSLHDWGVDFAVWCSYKYLNAGPGAIGGLYMHEKWNGTCAPKYAGWWGHELSTRFDMPHAFSPITGAQGFQQSNPSVFALAPLLGSLQIFKEAGMMQPLRRYSIMLTQCLSLNLCQSKYFIEEADLAVNTTVTRCKPRFTIITPSNYEERGAQLSLLFFPRDSDVVNRVYDYLISCGVIGDTRKPDILRLTPAPLYNTIHDCSRAAQHLEEALNSLSPETERLA